MTLNKLIARARSAVGRGIRYRLGKGGMNPNRLVPADAAGFCDCSGFVCWALGISRKTDHPLYGRFNGGWINTDAMVNDYREPTGLFRPATNAVPGVILVFPSGKGAKVGHCGIVVELERNSGLPVIVHCSNGNDKKRGDAIAETDSRIFQRPDTVAIWYEGLRQPKAIGNLRFG